MSSLLPRLGLRRWLAHKVLGWEYVECWHDDYVEGRRIEGVYLDGKAWRPLFDGLSTLTGALESNGGFSRNLRWYVTRWHPLTPGVAGFYRGTETDKHGL